MQNILVKSTRYPLAHPVHNTDATLRAWFERIQISSQYPPIFKFSYFLLLRGDFQAVVFGPWARFLLRQYFRNIIKNCLQTKRNLKPFARTSQPCRPVCNYNATVLSTWENCSGPNRSSMKRRVRSHFGSTDALHFQVGRSDCLVLINGKRLK